MLRFFLRNSRICWRMGKNQSTKTSLSIGMNSGPVVAKWPQMDTFSQRRNTWTRCSSENPDSPFWWFVCLMGAKSPTGTLSISTNTVSRHRQEILGKLQVKNSIEACRVAKDLKLIWASDKIQNFYCGLGNESKLKWDIGNKLYRKRRSYAYWHSKWVKNQ